MLNSSEVIYPAVWTGDVAATQAFLLKEDSVDLTSTDSPNKLALHYALMFSVEEDPNLKANKIRIANLLMQHAQQMLAQRDETGRTPFYLMAVADLDELLKKAMDLDPSLVSIPNNDDQYPIHAAMANQSHKVTDLLLGDPAMRHLIDNENRTLIHHAAGMNNLHALDQLLNHYTDCEQDINLLDESGHTALDIAIENGFDDISDLLQKHGGKTHDQISQNSP